DRTPTPAAPTAPIVWHDPLEGWQLATAEQKPLLVYFYAPRLNTTTQLNQIFASEPEARALAAGHIATKIDVNQLEGGTYAQRFNVTRVPTILLIGNDGQ